MTQPKIETTVAPSGAGGSKLDTGKPLWGLFPFEIFGARGVVREVQRWARRSEHAKPTLKVVIDEYYPPKSAIWGEVVEVLEAGAKKYAPYNWEKGIAYSRCYHAFCRHWAAMHRGEQIDPEFGLSHEAHALCELVFLATFEARGMREFDDRPQAPIAPLKPDTMTDYDYGPWVAPKWVFDVCRSWLGEPCTVAALQAIRDELRTAALGQGAEAIHWSRRVRLWFDGSQLMLSSLPPDIACHSPEQYPNAVHLPPTRRIEDLPILDPKEARPYIWGIGGAVLRLDPQNVKELPSMDTIAAVLSRLYRWTGHQGSWTVAHHCLLVSEIVARECDGRNISVSLMPDYDRYRMTLAALLHDASEAIFGDTSTPVKAKLRSTNGRTPVDDLASRFDRLVLDREGIGVSTDERATIKRADVLAAMIEAEEVMQVPRAAVLRHFEAHQYDGGVPTVREVDVEALRRLRTRDPSSTFLYEYGRLTAMLNMLRGSKP